MAKYTVKWGETLSGIAKENNTTVQELVAANNIANPDKIYADQVLTIPDVSTSAPAGGGSVLVGQQTQQPVTQTGTNTPAGQGASQPVTGMTGIRPGHQFTFDEQLNQIYDEVMGQGKFSYDLNGDPLWQQYSDQYTAKGKMAMLDTMGQAAALTGGHGSSYGQNVGQQAYQGYMQQLNDRVPELYQLALQKYNADQALLKDKLAVTKAMADREYGQEQDAIDMWYKDETFARQDDQEKYAREQEEKKNFLGMISMGYDPTDAELKQFGITRQQFNSMRDYYAAQNAPTYREASWDDFEDFRSEAINIYSEDDAVRFIETLVAMGYDPKLAYQVLTEAGKAKYLTDATGV